MTKTTLIDYPCKFILKVIGHNSSEFEGQVVAVIRQYVPDLGEGAISERTGKGNKYSSLTVTIQANNQEQVDNIYCALNASPEIIMVL